MNIDNVSRDCLLAVLKPIICRHIHLGRRFNNIPQFWQTWNAKYVRLKDHTRSFQAYYHRATNLVNIIASLFVLPLITSLEISVPGHLGPEIVKVLQKDSQQSLVKRLQFSYCRLTYLLILTSMHYHPVIRAKGFEGTLAYTQLCFSLKSRC